MTPTVVRRLLPPTRQERAYALITAADSLGTGCFLAVSVVLFVRVIGVSPTQVGTALGIGGVLSLFGRVPLGRLADRVGHRRSLVLVHLIRAAAFPFYLIVHGLAAFLAITAFVLIVDGWESPVRKVVLYAFARPGDRIRISAYNRSVYNLAFAIGSLLGALALSGHGRLALQLVVAGNAASFLLAAWFARRLPPDPERARPSNARGAGHVRFAAVGLLLGTLFLCTSLLTIGLPLLVLRHFAGQQWLIGLTMTLNTAVAVTLQLRVSRGADDIRGSIRAAGRGGGLLVLACLLFFLTTETTGSSTAVEVLVLLLATLALSVGELSASAAVWGLGLTLRRHDVTAHNQSLWSMYNSLPQLVGPFVVAWSLHLFDDLGWLVLAAVIALATVALRPVASAVDARITREERLLTAPADCDPSEVPRSRDRVIAFPPAIHISSESRLKSPNPHTRPKGLEVSNAAVPVSWLVIGSHNLRSGLQRPPHWQVVLIQVPVQLLRPQAEDAVTYTLPMQDWPAMPTRTIDERGTILGESVQNLDDLLAGHRDVPLGLLRPAGTDLGQPAGHVRLHPHVDTYAGCTRYLRVPNPPVPLPDAAGDLFAVIDEHFLRVNNYLCYRVKLEPDVELEHKFTFTGAPDIHVLARDTMAGAAQDAFPGWIVEFREEIQSWDFLNHIYAISEPPEEVGYVSFIPTTDGRHTVKRKIFAEDTDERPELRSKGVAVGAGLLAHVQDTMGLQPDWQASFRRIRYDVSVEHIRSGNVFGIAFDRSTIIDEDGRRIDGRPELTQCEIEYIYSQSITAADFQSVRDDLADLRVSVADWFRARGLEFYETHESKLTWLRNQHVLAR